MYEIRFKKSAQKYFYNLHSNTQKEIISKLRKISLNPQKELLKLKKRKEYYFRVSSYRIIVDLLKNELIVDVIKIGHRAVIYRQMGI